MRTPEWRYTLWLRWDNVSLAPLWDGPSAEELYGHDNDNSSSFDLWENVNVVEANRGSAQKLRAQLRTFFEKH